MKKYPKLADRPQLYFCLANASCFKAAAVNVTPVTAAMSLRLRNMVAELQMLDVSPESGNFVKEVLIFGMAAAICC